MTTIYLAGSLFNAGERLHNLLLEEQLKRLGHTVILPQREAVKFMGPQGQVDVKAIAQDCWQSCTSPDNIYVGCIDGADADSGTSFELGAAMTANRRAVVYRTDFRTAEEKEVGVNAMLRVDGVRYIFKPCFYTSLDEADQFYRELAEEIDRVIQKIIQ